MLGSAMVSGSTVLLSMAAGRFMDMSFFGGFTLALTTAQLLYVLALFGGNDLQMVDYLPRFSFRTYARLRIGTCLIACAAGYIAAAALHFSNAAAFCCFFLTAHMILNALAELYQSAFFQHDRLDLSGRSCFFRYLLSTAAFVGGFAVAGNEGGAFAAMLAVNLVATWWWDLLIAGPFTSPAGVSEAGGQASAAMTSTAGGGAVAMGGTAGSGAAAMGGTAGSGAAAMGDTVGDASGGPSGTVSALLAEAAPVGMSVFISQLIINCPRYLIGMSHDDAVQGVYHLLFLPTYVINMLGLFIFRPVLHAYADALQHDRRLFGRMLARHTGIIAALSALAAAGMYLLGPLMIRILFHQEVGAFRAFQAAFMVPGGMMALSQLLYYLLVMEHKQGRMMAVYLLGGLSTLVLGGKMIPADAVFGAWVSFTGGQAVILLGFLICLGGQVNG